MVRADYSRSWWVGSVPVNGPLFDWARISQVVIHYPGNPPSWRVPVNVAGQIRSSHESYVRNRGYSYGYNYVVVSETGHPLDGRSVEVRGETFRCAANAGVNHQSVAIQVLQQSDQPPTAAAVEGVRRLVAQFQVAARQPLRIVGHDGSGGTTRTACPGRGLQAAVDAGVFWPVAGSQLPDVPQRWQEADMYTVTHPTRVYDSRRGRKLSAGQTVTVSTNLPAGAKAAHVNLTAIMDRPGFITAWAAGNRPDTSVLNAQPGQAVANAVTVPVDGVGRIRVYAHSPAHLIVDVMGWYR
jgi:hypothetical protein